MLLSTTTRNWEVEKSKNAHVSLIGNNKLLISKKDIERKQTPNELILRERQQVHKKRKYLADATFIVTERESMLMSRQYSAVSGKKPEDFQLINRSFLSFALDLKDKRERSGYCYGVLIVLSYLLIIVTFPFSLCFCLKVGDSVYFLLSFLSLKRIGCTRVWKSSYLPTRPYSSQWSAR